ncbi:hypothetical protein BDR22DRAFT_282973 [Usnea florida]
MKRSQQEEVRAQCVTIKSRQQLFERRDDVCFRLVVCYNTNCSKEDEKTSRYFYLCCAEPQRFKTRGNELSRRFNDGTVRERFFSLHGPGAIAGGSATIDWTREDHPGTSKLGQASKPGDLARPMHLRAASLSLQNMEPIKRAIIGAYHAFSTCAWIVPISKLGSDGAPYATKYSAVVMGYNALASLKLVRSR